MRSIDNKHEIEYSIKDNIGYFNIIEIDYNALKSLIYFLKDIVEEYNKNNVKYVQQHMMIDDIDVLKYSEYYSLENGICLVNTKLENFIDEIGNLLGIEKL